MKILYPAKYFDPASTTVATIGLDVNWINMGLYGETSYTVPLCVKKWLGIVTE
jgi:hypothetical protein